MIAQGETRNGILEQEPLKLNNTTHNDSFPVADKISPTTLKTYVWFYETFWKSQLTPDGRQIRVKLEKKKLQMNQVILFSIYERLTYLLREGKLEIEL